MRAGSAFAAGVILAIVLAVAPAACASDPSPESPAPSKPPVDGQALQEAVRSMQNHLDGGLALIEQGRAAEGMSLLVRVLAEGSRMTAPPPRAAELMSRAGSELETVESSIAIEADPVWLDAGAHQRTASSVTRTPQPAVILSLRTPTGRSLISGAPIRFTFVCGGGELSGGGRTNAFGQSGCTVHRLDNPGAPSTIRAQLVFQVGDFVYPSEGVFLDFVYEAPARRALILALERSPLGPAEDPMVLRPVLARLRRLDYSFTLYSGRMEPPAFMRIYNGDTAEAEELGRDEGASTLMLVLGDCTSVRQVELMGRKRELYVSEARATVRLIRAADGELLFQRSVDVSKRTNTHGQGGSERTAVRDALARASEELGRVLEESLPALKAALKEAL